MEFSVLRSDEKWQAALSLRVALNGQGKPHFKSMSHDGLSTLEILTRDVGGRGGTFIDFAEWKDSLFIQVQALVCARKAKWVRREGSRLNDDPS